jgi:hypothetical protein
MTKNPVSTSVFAPLVCAVITLGIACQSRESVPDYQTTATVKDIMVSMVDPVADIIWNSVATIVSIEGTEERAPQTDEEWAEVRRAAITLIEATNALRIPGRLIARPGEKSAYPKIELEPSEIQMLVDQDRATWNRLARGLHDAVAEALVHIDARNPGGILDAGEKIEYACESCHSKYWYPNQVIPPVPKFPQ